MKQLLSKKKNQLTKKKKGFTLVELIIVIAIIAILAAMAIPKFGEIRESANVKSDLATAKNIATIVAQKLADGEELTGATVAAGDEIANNLNGDITPKANGKTSFKYTVSNGNVTVSYNEDTQIYPQSN